MRKLADAILLVDEHLDIVHANAAAEELIVLGGYLDRGGGRLGLINPLAQKARCRRRCGSR